DPVQLHYLPFSPFWLGLHAEWGDLCSTDAAGRAVIGDVIGLFKISEATLWLWVSVMPIRAHHKIMYSMKFGRGEFGGDEIDRPPNGDESLNVWPKRTRLGDFERVDTFVYFNAESGQLV